MKQTFEYLYQTVSMDNITINEVGDTTIKVLNHDAYAWFIIIETELGRTKIQTFGPLLEGSDLFTHYGFNYNYKELDYKESTLAKIIDQFINDPKKMVTKCFEIDKEEAINRFKEAVITNV